MLYPVRYCITLFDNQAPPDFGTCFRTTARCTVSPRRLKRSRKAAQAASSALYIRVTYSIILILYSVQLAVSAPFTVGDAASLAPGGYILSTHVKQGRRRVHHTSLDNLNDRPSNATVAKTRTLWKARAGSMSAPISPRRISTMLPLDLDVIIIGYCRSRASFRPVA